MTTTDWPPLSSATVPASLTLEAFAKLPPSWPDSIKTHRGVLLARIHPDNNRPSGDEDVIARALVFNPGVLVVPEARMIEGHLGRLTIRTTSLIPDPAKPGSEFDFDDDLTDLNISRYFAWLCVVTLREVMKLPVITLRSETQAAAEEAQL